MTNVRVGDAVVPLDMGLGTWRQAGVVEAAALHAVPKSLPVEAAATMSVKCGSARSRVLKVIQP